VDALAAETFTTETAAMTAVRPGVILTTALVLGGCGSPGPPGAPIDGAAPAADAPGLVDGRTPSPDLAVIAATEAGRDEGVADAGADAAAGAPDGPAAACGVCAAYAPAQAVGQLQDPQLNAVSGIAASWRTPGLLYVHNDRNRPEFVAVTEAGAMAGRFTLGGASALDIEDIAVGRCPAGTCVYLADLGNNVTPRTEFQIFRVPEPAMVANGTLTAERLVFTYPDGPHNAESLMIDPGTGALYVITKVAAGARSAAYRLPAFGSGGAATKVADLPIPAAGDQPATAADAHPCGAGFILRTNNTAYELRIPVGTPFEEAFKAQPMMVPVGNEMQGEGISYRPDGRGYYTTSEGARPPIHRVGCR
jgi:hypothetical protein